MSGPGPSGPYAHGLLAGAEPPSIPILLEWLDANGIQVHPALRVVSMEDGEGWMVRAEEEIEPPELLCSIPKTAILSHRSSSLPPIESLSILSQRTPPSTSKTNHSILHLALAVLHELRLAGASRFWGYLQSLPRATPLLPVFWGVAQMCGEDGAEGLRWLKGTEGEREMLRKEEEGLSYDHLSSFYSLFCPYLPATAAHPFPSPLPAFLHAFALITTRAFTLDLYHHLALVPFCDLLNHSSAAPHTSLASDEFVCHLCGSLASCAHDDGAAPRRLEHLGERDRRRIEAKEDGGDTVEMRCEREVAGGEEVYNSYGEGMGDGKVLVEWGFLDEGSAGSGLGLDLDDIAAVLALGADREEAERRGRTEEEEEEEEVVGWRKVTWGEIMRRGEVTLALRLWRQRPETSGGEDTLIGAHQGTAGQGAIGQDGEVDVNLFVWVVLCILGRASTMGGATPSKQNVRAAEVVVVRVAKELEHAWARVQAFEDERSDDGDDAGGEALSEDAGMVAGGVLRVIRWRLGRMYRPELSTAELFDEMDRLPSAGRRLTRMAMTLAANERVLLEATLAKWASVLGHPPE